MEYRTGADEGFPTESSNRNTGIVRYSGAVKVPSGKVPRRMDTTDMEYQIHCTETEAYTAVLRAFIAQSDVLSWGKEELISDLRKELRVSDVEHRQLLAKVNLDDSVRMIREWRKGTGGEKQMLSNTLNPVGSVPSSTEHASRKRSKPLHPPVSALTNYQSLAQPSPIHFRDSQPVGEVAILSSKASADQSMKSVYDGRHTTIGGEGSRQVLVQSNKYQPSHTNSSEKGSCMINIRSTDVLIREVERAISGGGRSNQVEVDRAKSVLREHEKAILEALDKLTDLLDDEAPADHSQHWNTYDGQQRNEHQVGAHQPFSSR